MRAIVVIVLLVFLTGCKKTETVIYGRVSVYETNVPLANHPIRIYGSYGKDGGLFDYLIQETTTDENGNYRFQFQKIPNVFPERVWIPNINTSSFYEGDPFSHGIYSEQRRSNFYAEPLNKTHSHTTVEVGTIFR